MKSDLSSLPDDARLSKHDIASLIELVEQKYEEKIHYLEERIRLLQNELFGRKSEKRYPEDHRQLPIFTSSEGESEAQTTPVDDTIVIPAHTRKKRGRKPLPEHLPRVEIIHDLPEEEKVCACGAALSRIGQDTCEKLDYVPAKVRVLRHIRYKYACKCCEGVEDDGPTVKIAPAPVQLIEKSMATEGLLAHIIVSKFADALPLYRQHGCRFIPGDHGQLGGSSGRTVRSLNRTFGTRDPQRSFDPDGRNTTSGFKRAGPRQYEQILYVGVLRRSSRSSFGAVPVSAHTQRQGGARLFG